MSKSRRDNRSLVLASLVAPFIVVALAAGPQVTAPDESPPSAVEQALIDYACGPQVGDVRQACLSSQLLSLRTTFGRDLRRLSASERKTPALSCRRRGRSTSGRSSRRGGIPPSSIPIVPPPTLWAILYARSIPAPCAFVLKEAAAT